MRGGKWRLWWIGVRFGKWGIGVWADGKTMRWIDPTDLWGFVIGRSER